MTVKYTTINPSYKPEPLFDVVSVTQVGTHTYELYRIIAYGQRQKVRLTDVETLQIDNRCGCHPQG